MPETTMTYDDYEFEPVPFIRMGRTANKTASGEILGFSWQITLSGDLVVAPSGSIINIDDQQDRLAEALAEQGKHLNVECGGVTILSVYPRINALNFEQGVWVNRSPYTVEMEFDSLPEGTGTIDYIADYSEEWSFEFAEDKTEFEWALPDTTADYLPFQVRITHNVNATGKSVYDSGGLVKPAYQQARRFVSDRLGLDNEYVENSGVINLDAASFTAYNHFRTVNANEAGGSYSVNESWLLLSDDDALAGHATEDFTISVRTAAETPIRTVSIEGSVQGLESRSYGSVPGQFQITESKYDAAKDYWNVVQGRLLGRCDLVLNEVSTVRDLNIIPISTSEAHNPYAGTIQYSYEYSDRPSNCLTDSLFENIVITDNNPADVFATLFILGRANGPVLQDLGTRTAGTRSIQIEAVYEPPNICPTSVDNIAEYLGYQIKSPGEIDAEDIIDTLEAHLNSEYSQVFRNEDTESWTPKEGRFSRNVTWTYNNC